MPPAGAVWRAEDGISVSDLARLMGHSNEMAMYRDDPR
jgi:hypothetical protein